MKKPLSLNSLSFSDTKGNVLVIEDDYITFYGDKADDALEKFIQERYNYWKGFYNMDLVFAQDSGETLTELEVRKTVRLIAKCRGVDYKGVKSNSRKSEYIEVRRMAIGLCTERRVRLRTIGRAMNIGHANVIHHRDTLKNLCDTDRKYKEEYDEACDYVASFMNITNNQ